MRKIKKFLLLTMCACVLYGVTACGTNRDTTNGTTNTTEDNNLNDATKGTDDTNIRNNNNDGVVDKAVDDVTDTVDRAADDLTNNNGTEKDNLNNRNTNE